MSGFLTEQICPRLGASSGRGKAFLCGLSPDKVLGPHCRLMRAPDPESPRDSDKESTLYRPC